MPDLMHIRDLSLECIIGTNPDERETRQEVIVNITLECALAAAGKSDNLDDTINYKTLKKKIVAFVEGSEFFLVEKLADRIAAMCLDDPLTLAATVTVDKPRALTSARSVAVEIRREREE